MTTKYNIEATTFGNVRNRVVVLAGGATGIGAALIKTLHSHGAKVVFGDVNETDALKIVEDLSRSSDDGGSVDFIRTDVTVYSEMVKLFQVALDKYGKVDVASHLAAIVDSPGWFDRCITIEDIQQPPNTRSLEITLMSYIYFANIASVYLTQNVPSNTHSDKSIVIMSSSLGFTTIPGVILYETSKHALIGLARGLSQRLPKSHGIRVNVICPSITSTSLTGPVQSGWNTTGAEVNSAEDVARLILATTVDEKLNGGMLYMAGGKAWEIGGGLRETQAIWLGQNVSEDLDKALECLTGMLRL